MSGEIPASIGNLINLVELRFLLITLVDLYQGLSGNLTQLTSLNLFGNQVAGIPFDSDFSGDTTSILREFN